jgi:hypothetical protein
MTFKKLRRPLIIYAPAALVFFASSAIALAQTQGGGGGVQLVNPLKFGDIASFIAGALKVLVMVALPVITLFVVYSGFMFVTAQGRPEKLKEAKTNFVYVILGALLIMGAWIIATLIGGTVSQLTNGL